MSKSANQRLVDALVRHQAFLVGHARDLAERLGKTLDETTPEMRKHLLETFASNDQSPSARKLRSVEARLFGLRQPRWNAVREQLIGSIADLVSYEPEFLHRLVGALRDDVGRLWELPSSQSLRATVGKALIAGRTIAEHIVSIARADLARISGATRIGYLARETAQQIAVRVLGTTRALSPVLSTAARALETVVSTAVHAMSSAALDQAARADKNGLFQELELWVSVLDTRTTEGCRKLNGKTFRRGEGIRPGYHYYCRSIRVPIINDGGKVTYLDSFAVWLEQQNGKFKNFLRGKNVFSRDAVPSLSLDDVKRWDKDTLE